MSTPAQIMVEGNSVKLYCHFDGSPDIVLSIMTGYVKDFLQYRGFDKDYLIARLTQLFCNHCGEALRTGFGLGTTWNIYNGTDYAYVITKKSISAYRAKRYCEKSNFALTDLGILINLSYKDAGYDETMLKVEHIKSVNLD